jgi:translation initiation factor IF-3
MAIAKQDRVRVNQLIRTPLVRLVDAEGGQVGIVAIDQALSLAAEAGLDLVEVAPSAEPPVCRIMDYGKYKFQQAKKAQEAKKKQTQTQVKEIKMRPKIEDHDFGFKLRNVLKFLEEHDRVKVTVQFRGREIAYAESGRRLLERVIAEVGEKGTVEGSPKMEGRFLSVFIAPK